MAMTPVTGRLSHEERSSDRAARRTLAVIIGFSVAVTGLLLIVMIPAGIARRLERECPRDQRTPGLKAESWVYDRSSWNPLNWNCTVEHFDGTTATYQPVSTEVSVVLAALLIATVIPAVWLVRRARATTPLAS